MASENNATTPSSSRSRNSRVVRRNRDSPRARPYPNPINVDNPNNRVPRRVEARRWGWLSSALNTWRTVEGMNIITEPMDASPYTQEPVHHTVPILAARLHRHEDRLDDIQMEQYRHETRIRDMEIEQEETRSTWMNLANGRVAQIYQDQEDLAETMEIVHNQVIGNRNEISVLQTRLVESETRILEAEDHARILERRLEQAIGMITRLTENVERVVTLLPPPSPHQD